MQDCLINIDPETIRTAGPFMGAALTMLVFQVLVIARVKVAKVRVILTLGSAAVMAVALIGGMVYAFMHGV